MSSETFLLHIHHLPTSPNMSLFYGDAIRNDQNLVNLLASMQIVGQPAAPADEVLQAGRPRPRRIDGPPRIVDVSDSDSDDDNRPGPRHMEVHQHRAHPPTSRRTGHLPRAVVVGDGGYRRSGGYAFGDPNDPVAWVDRDVRAPINRALPLAIQQPSGPDANPGKYSLDFGVPFLILICYLAAVPVPQIQPALIQGLDNEAYNVSSGRRTGIRGSW
jgi:hypothetical protein